jgi:hypothetical protein
MVIYIHGVEEETLLGHYCIIPRSSLSYLIKSRFFMEEATNFDSKRVFTLTEKIINLNQTFQTNIFIMKQLPVVDQL